MLVAVEACPGDWFWLSPYELRANVPPGLGYMDKRI